MRVSRLLLATIALLLAPLAWIDDLRATIPLYVILVTVAALLVYVGVGWMERSGRDIPMRTILLGALLLRLLVLPMQPSLSDDAWRYLWDGRLLLHGINPYLVTPADTWLARFHDDLFRRQGYPTTNTIYPPGAQIVFASSMAVSEAVGSEYLVGYYFYKASILGLELLVVGMLLQALRLRGMPLRRAILYAWHPLPIIELTGQGHTDILWGAALVAGVLFLLRDQKGPALGALAAGASARLYPLGVMPLFLRYRSSVAGGSQSSNPSSLESAEQRRDWVVGMLLGIPFILLFLVFLDTEAVASFGRVLGRFTNYYEFNGGFYYVVKLVADALHLDPSNMVAGAICSVLGVTGHLLVWLRPMRRGDIEEFLSRLLLLLTLEIGLGAKAHIWYFTAPLALLPLMDRSALRPVWLWLAVAGPFTYLMFESNPVAERYDVLLLEWGIAALIFIIAHHRNSN